MKRVYNRHLEGLVFWGLGFRLPLLQFLLNLFSIAQAMRRLLKTVRECLDLTQRRGDLPTLRAHVPK